MNTKYATAVASVWLVAGGCATTYYQQPGALGYYVRGGADERPRGEEVVINPAVIEYVLSQPESRIANYYEIALALRDKQGATPAKQKVFDELRADLAVLEPRLSEVTVPLGVPECERYARLVATILAPHVAASLVDKRQARIVWGRKVATDGESLQEAYNVLFVTASEQRSVVCLFRNDPSGDGTTLSPVSFNIGAVEGAQTSGSALGFDDVAASIQKLEEPDPACTSAMLPSHS